MQGDFFEKVQATFKKAFKKHHDTLFKTVQSKPILINEKPYVLVGESRIQNFPLISHFDVFDAQGNSAGEDIGRSVHTLITQILLTEHIRSIQASLQQQKDENSSVTSEVVDAETASIHLEQLTARVDNIQRNEIIDEEDMHAVHVAWNSFWEHYQPRIQALMQAYQAQTIQKSTSLLEEVGTMRKLYQSLLYGDDCPPMTAVIEDSYMYGRLRPQDAPLETPNKGERKMYAVFIGIFRVVIVIAAIIILALFIEGESIVEALVPVAIPLGASTIIKAQSKSRLLSKSNTFYSELRMGAKGQFASSEAVATKTREPLERKQATSPEKKQETIHYETRAIVVNHLIIFGIFALVSWGIAIYIYIEGELGIGPAVIMTLIGAGFVVIMFVLSLTPLVKQRIVLTDQTIYLRKERISMLEVERIVAKSNGKTIQIFVDYHDSPHRIRMMSGDEEKVTAAFQMWSQNNRISFEDQTKKKH